MYYTIYKTTNNLNDKIYIGCHKTENLEDEYLGSGKILKYAIDKNGKENFTKEILKVFNNPEDMFSMEAELVNEEYLEREDIYNLVAGGNGGNKILDKNHHTHSKEHMNKMQKAAAEKLIENLKNETFKDAYYKHLKNIGIIGNQTRVYTSGIESPNYGKTHSVETKKLMSIKAKERLKDPTKNSQYGKMWIYSDSLKESKRIDKNSLIPEGWLKGRKQKF